jgi:hypothetical protein
MEEHMLTGIGIALMIAMMGAMALGGHKLMNRGHQKGAQMQAPVLTSSAPAAGADAGAGEHSH